MTSKIHPDFREKYKEVRAELHRLQSNEFLNKIQASVLEFSIFKSLPQVCKKCGSTKGLTLDHIIPKSFLADVGIDVGSEVVENNYQVLCNYCNSKKASRIDIREEGVKELLKQIINSL